MKKDKITIIGGAGFVGTHLCRKLFKKKEDFEIIDLKKSNQFSDKCKIGDIRNLQNLRDMITGNIVINLAAVHRDDIKDKTQYHLTNVVGAENLSVVCREKGINKIIFTSSVAVYGFAKPGTGEEGKINPFNEYGWSKFEAEERLRVWQGGGDNALIIVRPTVIFGEGNRGNVFNLLNSISSGKFLMIGDGENKKSIAYIENVVSFLQNCIETNQKYGVYNYVDTPNLTMNDLVSHVRHMLKGKIGVGVRVPYFLALLAGYCADALATIIGRSLPISSIRVKKFSSSTEFSSAKSDLDNFKPPYKLEEGLNRTLKSEFISPNPKREIFFTE